MAKTKIGRRAIFEESKTIRLQGVISTPGGKAFEAARRRLKILAKWKGRVSDADTIEFLARGEANTIAYLAAKHRRAS